MELCIHIRCRCIITIILGLATSIYGASRRRCTESCVHCLLRNWTETYTVKGVGVAAIMPVGSVAKISVAVIPVLASEFGSIPLLCFDTGVSIYKGIANTGV